MIYYNVILLYPICLSTYVNFNIYRNGEPVKKKRYKKPPAKIKAVQEKVANQRHKRVNIVWKWPASGSVITKSSLAVGIVTSTIAISGLTVHDAEIQCATEFAAELEAALRSWQVAIA